MKSKELPVKQAIISQKKIPKTNHILQEVGVSVSNLTIKWRFYHSKYKQFTTRCKPGLKTARPDNRLPKTSTKNPSTVPWRRR